MSEIQSYSRLSNITIYRNLRSGEDPKSVRSRIETDPPAERQKPEESISSPLPLTLDDLVELPIKLESGMSNMTPSKVGADFEPRGLYINAGTAGRASAMSIITAMKAKGFNAMIFDAKNCDGYVRFSSPVPTASSNRFVSAAYPLKKLIFLAKKEGIHSSARIAVFYDAVLAKSRPDLRLKYIGINRPAELDSWVDPRSDEVADYNLKIAVELARAGVDEINFDYVRFPAFRGVDTGNVDRAEVISSFLKKAKEVLKPYGVRISADVFAVTVWKDNDPTIRTIGQDLRKMAQHLDAVYLMAYPSHFSGIPGIEIPADHPYELVKKTCEYTKEMFKDLPAKPALFLTAFPDRNVSFLYGKEYVREELRAMRDGGMNSYFFWNAGGYYARVFSAITNEVMIASSARSR